MRDSAVIGLKSGIVGGIFHQVFIWAFYLLGIADVIPSQLGAYLLANPTDITALPAQTIGMVVHFTTSTILGLIGVYVLRTMGTDYLWIKGVAYGATIYLLLYGAIAKLFIPVEVLQPNLVTSGVFLFGHLIFGMITIFLAGYYLKEGFRTKQ